jgi:glutaminyl-peptide cyclotransferase
VLLKRTLGACLFLFLVGFTLNFSPARRDVTTAPVYGYTVVARYPHSTENYTEGFFYLEGLFYEGTGGKGIPV